MERLLIGIQKIWWRLIKARYFCVSTEWMIPNSIFNQMLPPDVDVVADRYPFLPWFEFIVVVKSLFVLRAFFKSVKLDPKKILVFEQFLIIWLNFKTSWLPKASQIALLIHSTAHYPLLVWWQRLPIKVVHHLPIFNEKAATLLVRDFLQFLPGCWVWESLFKVKMKLCACQTICQREKLILNNSTKFHVVLKKVHISSTFTITFWPYQTY